MKTLTRLPQIFAWILLVLVLSEFVFVAYNWLSYCSPVAAVRFAFSGAWLKEEFQHVNAGYTLDQPTIGKFFLWTSLMSYLACTIIMLAHIVVDVDRRMTRRWVSLCAALLVAIVLIMNTGRHCHMAFIFRPNDSDSNLYDLVFREESYLEHGIRLYSVRKE